MVVNANLGCVVLEKQILGVNKVDCWCERGKWFSNVTGLEWVTIRCRERERKPPPAEAIQDLHGHAHTLTLPSISPNPRALEIFGGEHPRYPLIPTGKREQRRRAHSKSV